MSPELTLVPLKSSEPLDTPAQQTAVTPKPRKPRPAKEPSYRRVTDAERISILAMHGKGISQTAISQRLNRSIETINRIVHDYTPTVDLAKQFLAAKSHEMAKRTLRKGRASDYVNVLKGLGVLEEKTQSGVIINIGVSAELVQVALSPQPSLPPSET